MAVVQISKIQVRRGQKNSNSGIPQLSSAEFAWAVDSQELFIGNGSVAEGAPYVGNTKILTEHDNILELANSYQFANDDNSITFAVPRTLQNKLDEYVSVADFGAVGDGSTDCVAAFESAFTELFRNTNPNYKKILLIPNGEYLFTSDIRVPSGVVLQGETKLGAVLNMNAHNIRFITNTGLELSDFNSTNRPSNIYFHNFTIKRTTGQLTCTGLSKSTFSNIKFEGEYQLASTVASLVSEPSAVFWQNDLFGIRTTDLTFEKCDFESNSLAIKCSQTAVFETNIVINDCKFSTADTAVYINGVPGQTNAWKIIDCKFEEIAKQAFRSTNGNYTVITQSEFKNVGNGLGTATNPTDVMVYFGESNGNLVIDCFSNRLQNAALNPSTVSSTASYVEAYNSDKSSWADRIYSTIYLSDSFRPLVVLSAFNKYHVINYTLRLGTHTRQGQLWLSVGQDLAGEDNTSSVAVTDNFQYSPQFITSEGGAMMTNFEFSASLRGNAGDSGIETLVLSYKNPLATGAVGTISFDVTYGV
jgi:hypothetical protein